MFLYKSCLNVPKVTDFVEKMASSVLTDGSSSGEDDGFYSNVGMALTVVK